LAVLQGASPVFDTASAPEDPADLFIEWMLTAVRAGVPEPHAMTVSTVDASGAPNARTLILKDVDAAGWHFAISTASRKGAELTLKPSAALTFYWSASVRQVRVRGHVVPDSRDLSRADFLARSTGSRAMALTRQQSEPLADPADLERALEKAHRELQVDPTTVPDEWVSYAVQPASVEFWQGDPERRHQRLNYVRDGQQWTRTILWP
jgi:pyridoxamine 5'-phosphate oxidase